MVFGFSNEQTRDQGTHYGREAYRGRCETRSYDHQHGCCEKELRAFGSRSLSEETWQCDPACDHHDRNHRCPLPQCGHQAFPSFRSGIGSHRAENEDDRHDHDVFEKQH